MSGRDHRQAGDTRHKLAELLRAALTAEGIEFLPFDGESLIPVRGYWKRQDVYRWESVGLKAIRHGKVLGMSICGWGKMTDIVRSGGAVLSQHHRDLPCQFEADPKEKA